MRNLVQPGAAQGAECELLKQVSLVLEILMADPRRW